MASIMRKCAECGADLRFTTGQQVPAYVICANCAPRMAKVAKMNADPMPEGGKKKSRASKAVDKVKAAVGK